VPAFATSAVGTVLDWNYTTEPSSQACLNNGGRCKWPRGKMVSGTSGTVTFQQQCLSHTGKRTLSPVRDKQQNPS